MSSRVEAMAPKLEERLEAETIGLNRWLYDEMIGLPVEEQGQAQHSQALIERYAEILVSPPRDQALYYCALDNWSEARRVALDFRISAAMDEQLALPDLECSEGRLSWRNWRTFEHETTDAARLADAFHRFVSLSAAVTPLLEERWALMRADYAAHGLTPIHTFAFREGTTPEALCTLLREIGRACREPYQAALAALSREVFGRDPGPAEMHALFLNRMYDPLTSVFDGRRPGSDLEAAGGIVREVQDVFARMGFDLHGIPVDLEPRLHKYPGAFCFPIATPGDVRISVRMASPHHLADMLYHEFGHALHFTGIDPALSFVDRYWIHSGTHETFSTLFECLLGEPVFLRQQYGVGEATLERLLDFHRFKMLLNGTWVAASALTVAEAWLEDLAWGEVEARCAEHFLAFTGVPMPAGFARLEAFVPSLTIYPAGYILAAVRVGHWLKRLRLLGGTEWWRSATVRADIRARVRAGGAVRFPDGWLAAEEFVKAFC